MTGTNILISHESGSEEQYPLFGNQRCRRFRFTGLITAGSAIRYHGQASVHASL